ncbi:MAG TPA: C40 family peptidase [Candidatus Baltobacteraceae bacterium]|nr:C40 family peptidase [Candidatus Baltobacteraceae bacterium]
MRYLFGTGVLAFFVAASSAFALANPADTVAPATAVTSPAATSAAPAPASATSAVTATTSAAPATSGTTPTAPVTAAATEDGPGVPVESPDVAEWTAQLLHEQQSQAAKKAAAPARGLGKFAARILSRTSTIAKNLTRDALHFLGTPYVFGGTTSSGFDCSGFVQHVFAMLGINVPRTADAQYYAGRRTKGGMKAGDLVFFQTYEPGPSHVGIYLGHGKFVHASSSHGVMVSNLSDSYWAERYLGAKRVLSSMR